MHERRTLMNEGKTYTYIRYMRDGSTKEMTGVVRSRKKKKKENKSEG